MHESRNYNPSGKPMKPVPIDRDANSHGIVLNGRPVRGWDPVGFNSGVVAAQGGRPRGSKYIPDKTPYQAMGIDQMVKLVVDRRVAGIDGRYAKVTNIRDVTSDYNKPTDGRPSPYTAEIMNRSINRIFAREFEIDARTGESAIQTLQSVEAEVAAQTALYARKRTDHLFFDEAEFQRAFEVASKSKDFNVQDWAEKYAASQ